VTRKVLKLLRTWFIAGIVLIAPLGVTIFILNILFTSLDGPIRRTIADLTGFDVPGTGVLATVVVILIAGGIASSIALKGIFNWIERALFDRIPLVRTLYGAIKQLIAPLGDAKANPFQHVVMVEFPEAGTYSLGFLVKEDAATAPTGENLSAVMVPTNHGYLGFVGLYPAVKVHPVDMSAEEALKFLVSMGIALDRKVSLGTFKPAMPRIPVSDTTKY